MINFVNHLIDISIILGYLEYKDDHFKVVTKEFAIERRTTVLEEKYNRIGKRKFNEKRFFIKCEHLSFVCLLYITIARIVPTGTWWVVWAWLLVIVVCWTTILWFFTIYRVFYYGCWAVICPNSSTEHYTTPKEYYNSGTASILVGLIVFLPDSSENQIWRRCLYLRHRASFTMLLNWL